MGKPRISAVERAEVARVTPEVVAGEGEAVTIRQMIAEVDVPPACDGIGRPTQDRCAELPVRAPAPWDAPRQFQWWRRAVWGGFLPSDFQGFVFRVRFQFDPVHRHRQHRVVTDAGRQLHILVGSQPRHDRSRQRCVDAVLA